MILIKALIYCMITDTMISFKQHCSNRGSKLGSLLLGDILNLFPVDLSAYLSAFTRKQTLSIHSWIGSKFLPSFIYNIFKTFQHQPYSILNKLHLWLSCHRIWNYFNLHVNNFYTFLPYIHFSIGHFAKASKFLSSF